MLKDRLGVFVIPIRFSDSIGVYTDYLDFLCSLDHSGYDYIFIGEHLTDSHEDIQSSLIFAAALLAKTKRLKVALSVLPLTHYNIPLLIKQLEDLFKLGQDRLLIGFSPGALQSDLEYLGIDPADRYKIFCSKLEEFKLGINSSSLLSTIPKSFFFSTILSPLPLNAGKLFQQGFSALSSNFTHPSHLDAHYTCLTKNLGNARPSSSWHISSNLIPDIDSLSVQSRSIVNSTLSYIYNKLSINAPKIMLSDKYSMRDHSVESKALTRILLREQITTIDDLQRYLPRNFLGGKGALLVNLFDCLHDTCYVEQIYSLPEAING